MGAFSFTMDRLSTLSSVIGLPKNTGRDSLNLSQFEITLDDNAQRAFAEFNTGMKMLRKHGVRNGCDIQHIARQNIKLLHTNLKSCQAYRSGISRIRSYAINNQQWAWIPLFQNGDVNAGLLYLSAGTHVVVNKQTASITLRQQVLHSPFRQNSAQHETTQLFLSLMGKTEIHSQTGHHVPHTTPRTDILKNGEAFAESPERFKIHDLHTGGHASLLLNVQLYTQPSRPDPVI